MAHRLTPRVLAISADELCFIADRALDGMAATLSALGDDLANRRPALPGANSPYAIVFHSLGMLEFWLGDTVLGRPVERDREAEFVATGAVEPLVARVEEAKRALRAELPALDARAALRGQVPPAYADTPIGGSAGGALLHIVEELCQHHGQLELTRDLLLSDTSRAPS